jgi:hypothetical protein
VRIRIDTESCYEVKSMGRSRDRSVEVRSPSSRRELFGVLGAVAIIGGAAAVTLAVGLTGGAPEALGPNEVAFSSLGAVDRARFQEGLDRLREAEGVRASRGGWVAVEGFEMRAAGPTINYSAQGDRALLILIQETGERANDVRGTRDERHRILSNGALIHRSLWIRDRGSSDPRVIERPGEEGWREVRGF